MLSFFFSNKELDTLKMRYRALDEEYIHYKMDVHATEKTWSDEKKNLENTLAQLQAENEKLKKELSQTKQKAEQAEQEIFIKNQENQELVSKLEILEKHYQKEAQLQTQNDFYQNMFEQMTTFGQSFTAFQSSLSGLCHVLKTEITHIQDNTERITQQTRMKIEQISDCAHNAFQNNTTILNQMKSLDEKADEISDIVSVITSIASQTNLLSLNASVEAARAGEQGKGFAVVAQAVRELSQRTDSATKQIACLVNGIQSEIVLLRRSVEQVSEDNKAFNQIGGDLHNEINQLVTLSTEINQTFSSSVLTSFLELIKVDHLIYKFDIYKVFTGISKKKASEFSSHQNCRLGKWYYQGEGRYFNQCHAYGALATPHEQFHQAGMKAVEAFYAHDYVKAIKQLSILEDKSLLVIKHIDDLGTEKQQSKNHTIDRHQLKFSLCDHKHDH